MSKSITCLTFILFVLLESCSNVLHLKVTEQAEINLADNIKTIVVFNKLHYLDNRSDDCIREFVKVISNYPCYNVKIASNQTGITQSDYYLSDEIMDSICRMNNADALVILEQFHCDIIENILEFDKCQAKSDFDYEWRLYDYKNHKIIDEILKSDHLVWERRAIKNRYYKSPPYECNYNFSTEYIRQTAFRVGNNYANRISPHWIKEKRHFYKHGDSLGLATRKALREKDWKSAEQIWTNETNNTNKKVAGKACFNLAVANEREGNLQGALLWADQAKQDGIKYAPEYINILSKRIKKTKQ